MTSRAALGLFFTISEARNGRQAFQFYNRYLALRAAFQAPRGVAPAGSLCLLM